MTDDAKRRKIKQLRALADSTTFPAEAESARAKANKLEAELAPPASHAADAAAYANAYNAAANQQSPDPRAYVNSESYLNAVMQQQMRRYYEQRLDEILRGRRGS